jgi:hypothetical protein
MLLNAKKKYDVGILGWWYGKNYGSIMTYYGLNRAITNLGYDVLMVHEALGYNGWRVEWPDNILSMEFAKRVGYNYTQQVHFSQLPALNKRVKTFVVGSDQLWNPHVGRVNDDLFLDFAGSSNGRVAYSTSFGNRDTKKYKPEFIEKHSANLQKFDAISVREDYAVNVAKDIFGVDAVQTVDPVFLNDVSVYEELADTATIKQSGRYLATFFLDLTPEKKRVAVAVADKLGLDKIVVLPNPDGGRQIAEEIFDDERFEVLSEDAPENWLNAYKNAAYIVTDSFHGSAFAAIFEKPFSSIYNTKRGADRFVNLMNLLGFGDARRLYETDTNEAIDTNVNVAFELDYTEANARVQSESAKSLEWLRNALSIKHEASLKDNLKEILLNRAPKDVEGFLTQQRFIFRRKGSTTPITTKLRLRKSGRITGVLSDNEAYWRIENNELLLLDKDKQVTTVFNLGNITKHALDVSHVKLEGKFVNNPSVVHVLETAQTAQRLQQKNV